MRYLDITNRYLKLLEWLANPAAQLLQCTGRITVIAQDNAPIHTSHAVKHCLLLLDYLMVTKRAAHHLQQQKL